ncbi:MAG: cytosine/uracil/thiamine/allantoin permease [Saprospiraceae bacterium]|jgi:cytosine/uracil/thiamine/allantoin permease
MTNEDIVTLEEDLSHSNLYSEDLKPVPPEERTWSMWSLAALWVGMAVCIPTYLLASYMIGGGMSWLESLIIIGIANLIITIPMVLNGHAGVKYGIPFPVLGRSSFGTNGIQIPSMIRAIVACGWFGVNAWIGGMAIYSIFNVMTGLDPVIGLSAGKFVAFGVFWLFNMYFIWKGIESIKFLEQYSAPILIFMGLLMIGWGASKAGGVGNVLSQSKQLEKPAAVLENNDKESFILLNPIRDKEGKVKAEEYKINLRGNDGPWLPITNDQIRVNSDNADDINVQLRKKIGNDYVLSSAISPALKFGNNSQRSKLWSYFFWLNIMVGFWGTMALSISDITRYAASQKEQVKGQFIGLPGTMMLYSFVGIFVTCAATIFFQDILIVNDAPWDPIAFLAKFKNPWVVVIAQLFMIIATLSTNIAANVIAPSNAFSNLYPKGISFKMGGIITGIIGILICPWWLLGDISNILIFVSGFLGPVLGVMLADYYLVRKKTLQIAELYKRDGAYSYTKGFNISAMVALVIGVVVAIAGYKIPALSVIYDVSWFSGFIVSFILYYLLMRNQKIT